MPVAYIPAALHTTAQIKSARNSIIDSKFLRTTVQLCTVFKVCQTEYTWS